MKNASPLLVSGLLIVSAFAVVSAHAAPKTSAREYRPLNAKAVRIVVAAESNGKGATMTREGWSHFDGKQWEKAMDSFLSALEADPGDQSAAEGLTMSVYRSGDRISAAELAEEFSEVMPWIRGMVAETLLLDVRAEVERGELASTDALLERIPYGDGAYDRSRDLLASTEAIRTEEAKTAVAKVGE